MAGEQNFKIGIIGGHVQIDVYISNMLEHYGFKNFQAYNFRDALEMCQKENPDVIISDLKVGDQTIYDFMKKIPNKKIILTTGYDFDKKTISKFKNIIGVVLKPIDITLLLDMIRKELGIKEKKY